MSWTKPLEQPKSWMAEKSVSLPKESGPDPRIAQARDLVKIYRRSKVAEMLDVSRSTISKWCKGMA